MLVFNAGLETIEFSFNKNARNKKEGGTYIIKAGQQIDVPEEAVSLVEDPLCGPCLYGLVILRYGDDLTEKRRQGLNKYREFLERCIGWELARDVEREAAGYRVVSERAHVTKLKQSLEQVNASLKELDHGNISDATDEGKAKPGRPKRIQSPEILSGHN